MPGSDYPDPESYVSVACLTNDHLSCQVHPVVRCACPCHRDGAVDPSTDHSGPGGGGFRA